MPHVIVKLWPGKSEHQKQCLPQHHEGVMTTLGYGEDAISVGLEEVASRTGPRRFTSATSWTAPASSISGRAMNRCDGRRASASESWREFG